jgi:chromatin segregation and condensation protein Rec8/ScpA/Scc1 (kleisin family)
VLTKKKELRVPKKNTNRKQRKIARALRLEAELLKRLARLRANKIFKDIPSVVGIETSHKKPAKEVAPRKNRSGKKKVSNRVATQPLATSKKQRMVFKSAEDAFNRFVSYCCECGQEMVVHSYGIACPLDNEALLAYYIRGENCSKIKREEVVSASCVHEGCPRRGKEVKYSGEQLQLQANKKLRLVKALA